MQLIIRNATLNRQSVDIYIADGRFKAIVPAGQQPCEAEEVLDAKGYVVTPAFYNAHTHAAMTLLRGAADDLDLFDWLQNHIWPLERHMTADDIYVGTRLAILEMIKSGTVFFSDMYWHAPAVVRAVEEMGVRANIGSLCLSNGPEQASGLAEDFESLARVDHSDRVTFSIAPHAIYTVSPSRLRACATLSEQYSIPIHIHLSETEKEVSDCLKTYGVTPVEHLAQCGALTPRSVLAHSVHLTANDRTLIAKSGATIVHCPRSNLKLASGFFDWQASKQSGCKIAIGTDGAASSNNLDMREESKVAALIAKAVAKDPKVAPTAEILRAACLGGAQAYGLDAGVIQLGKLADCLLWNPAHHRFVADHNFDSNLLYSAESDALDTVICAGKILMRNRHVAGEDEIVQEAIRTTHALLARAR